VMTGCHMIAGLVVLWPVVGSL